MTSQEEARRNTILRRVAALMAKAMSTPFEAEADTFRAKAAELMDAYRIEQWEVAQAEAGKSRSSLRPVRIDINIDWWWGGDGQAFRSALWTMFLKICKHCAVITNVGTVDYSAHTISCFGLHSDITFVQMLFNDLYIQMADKIKPKYDPNQSLGQNVYRAKEAGMKYGEIARWCGHPEWIRVKGYSKRGLPQYEYDGKMIREMKKYAAANGLTVHKVINLGAYVEDFCQAYAFAVGQKLDVMRGESDTSSTGSLSLAIRDIEDLARDLMFDEFPKLRPHDPNCDCDLCHRCFDPKCKRVRCVAARKPVRGRAIKYRDPVHAAVARGRAAGQEASIMSRSEQVRGPRKEMS